MFSICSLPFKRNRYGRQAAIGLRQWGNAVTKFSDRVPLAEDSTLDNPRSYWDRLMMEQEAREKAKGAKLSASRSSRPESDENDLGELKLHQVLANRLIGESIPALIAGVSASMKTTERFPNSNQWNDLADAYRHFRWNYDMARRVGTAAAKAFADSNEVGSDNPANERTMDLRNNRLGRAMAVDPRFKHLSPDEAAELALRRGRLHGLKE